MKNWKAFFGTVTESILGPQAVSFGNIEDWDNLWQVMNELKYGKNVNIYYWECLTEWAFARNDIEKNHWHGNRMYASDLLISLEYDLENSSKRNLYIRKSYARKLPTPVEKHLNIDPLFTSERQSRPFVLYFTDESGKLTNPYPVVRWLELIEIWSTNGILKPLRK